MLAINVSIPNLTVARLEQFPSPQMTDEHPYRRSTISAHTASCGKVLRKSAQGCRKFGGRKKNKKIKNNTTKIQQSLAIAIAIAGDCNESFTIE